MLRPAVRCAGGVWRRAEDVFNRMVYYHCTPDAVTFTALISAYEKGAQELHTASMWQLALRAYEIVRLNTPLASCRGFVVWVESYAHKVRVAFCFRRHVVVTGYARPRSFQTLPGHQGHQEVRLRFICRI